MVQTASAQQRQVTLSGCVRDIESGEPLPSANIRLIGSAKGTATNREGVYRLLLPEGQHTLVISYVGYRSDTLRIWIDTLDVRRDVYLRRTIIPLSEVVVLGSQRDPAEQIILQAIAKKRKVLSQLQSYRFNAYTKTTFRVKNNRRGEPQDTVIAGLLETQTVGYWKFPNQYKEIITARRQSANFSPSQNVFTVGRILNLNDDIIVLGPHRIVGPTAQNALDYYTFTMLDTFAIDDIPVYRIRIAPKSNLQPLLEGTVSVEGRSFMVIDVDVQGNRALDLAPLSNFRFRQRFSLFQNRFWLPVESKVTYLVKLSFPPAPPVVWEQYSLIYDYDINSSLPAGVFDKYVLSALPTADQVDSTYWHNVNILPLTTDEEKAYKRIDSLMTHASILTRSIVWLTRLPMALKELPLTKLSDFFHFNRVEGAYLGLGLRFRQLVPATIVTLRTGYGLSDNTVKYFFGAEHALKSEGALSLGVEGYRSMSFREGDEFISSGEITWFSLLGKNDPVDYYLASGWSVFAGGRPFANVSSEIRFRAENHKSQTTNTNFSILRPSSKYRNNPPVTDGQMRSVILALSYDTRKFTDIGLFEAPDRSLNSLLLRFSVEHSDRAKLRSDFEFTRITFSSGLHLRTLSHGATDCYVRLGYALGEPPPQRLYDLYGATSGISHEGFFKTVGVKEYAGDRMASLLVEHNFGSLPFRALGVPLMQDLDFLLTAGAAWTGIFGASRILQTEQIRTNRNVLVEVGFAVSRLVTFFRLDFCWRLTEKAGRNFAITLSCLLL